MGNKDLKIMSFSSDWTSHDRKRKNRELLVLSVNVAACFINSLRMLTQSVSITCLCLTKLLSLIKWLRNSPTKPKTFTLLRNRQPRRNGDVFGRLD